jgi:hypothetical protein
MSRRSTAALLALVPTLLVATAVPAQRSRSMPPRLVLRADEVID